MSRPPLAPSARTLFAIAAASAVAASLSLGSPLTASAHNSLVASTPAAGSTLTELPTDFTITTDDDLLNLGGSDAGFALQVLDADGRYYGDGCLSVAGPTLTTIAAVGAPGDYTVRWQVVSTDGHALSDEFGFTWAPTDTSVQASRGSETPPVCGETASDVPQATASPFLTPSDSAAASAAESATPSPESRTSDEAASSANDAAPALMWVIGGAIVRAAAAAGVLALLRRRKV